MIIIIIIKGRYRQSSWPEEQPMSWLGFISSDCSSRACNCTASFTLATWTKCVLTNSKQPTSPPLTLHKALLPATNFRYQLTDPEGMDSLVS